MITEILRGNVLWSYDYELESISKNVKLFSGLFSFMKPLTRHAGSIVLTNNGILIDGPDRLSITLESMNELFLGFDDLFPANSVKNFGALWQPLRIEYYISAKETSKIYLNIDYNGLTAQNKLWYETLENLLS